MSETTYRHYKRLPVDLFVNKFIGDEPFACRTRDLSIDGAYLRKLIEPSKTGDESLIGLEFTLPGNHEVIWASGAVVREDDKNEASGVAIKFVSMADRHRKMLVDFIENADGWVVQTPKPAAQRR
jgi:c-di-GMP-binding flagellar brake protein YcgR